MQVDLTESIRERYEKRLRKVLKIEKYLLYNRDQKLGEIGSWIVTSSRGIKDAIKLLVEKGLSIYMHPKHGSAVFKWNHYEQDFICQLWRNEKKIEEFSTGNIKEVEQKMKDYWKYCKYHDESILGGN